MEEILALLAAVLGPFVVVAIVLAIIIPISPLIIMWQLHGIKNEIHFLRMRFFKVTGGSMPIPEDKESNQGGKDGRND